MKYTLLLRLAYFSILIFHILGLWFDVDSIIFTKPMLMPLLSIYYVASSIKWNKLWIIILGLSWLGDIFLMGEGTIYFLLGMFSFLLAHIGYTFIFKKQTGRSTAFHWLIDGILVIFAIAMLYVLFLNAGDLFYYIIFYVIAITLMGISVIHRDRSLRGYQLATIGALMFIISDSFIAFNKFVNPIQYASIIIMFLYGLGQYLMTEGYLFSEYKK